MNFVLSDKKQQMRKSTLMIMALQKIKYFFVKVENHNFREHLYGK